MTATNSIDQRIASIARGLTGVAGLDEIRSLLEAGKTPKGFWGKMANDLRATWMLNSGTATAPTGKREVTRDA